MQQKDRVPMQRGTVKCYDPAKGFGFIKPDYPGPDYFFHRSGLRSIESIDAGARVAFDVEAAARGERAVQIQEEEL